jgi:hypothetical protein
MFKKLKEIFRGVPLPEPKGGMVLEHRYWGDWHLIKILRVSNDKKAVIYKHIRSSGIDSSEISNNHQVNWVEVCKNYKEQE